VSETLSLIETLRPASAWDENGDLWATKLCCFWSYYLEHSAIDPTCIDHYTWTVSQWTKRQYCFVWPTGHD